MPSATSVAMSKVAYIERELGARSSRPACAVADHTH